MSGGAVVGPGVKELKTSKKKEREREIMTARLFFETRHCYRRWRHSRSDWSPLSQLEKEEERLTKWWTIGRGSFLSFSVIVSSLSYKGLSLFGDIIGSTYHLERFAFI